MVPGISQMLNNISVEIYLIKITICSSYLSLVFKPSPKLHGVRQYYVHGFCGSVPGVWRQHFSGLMSGDTAEMMWNDWGGSTSKMASSHLSDAWAGWGGWRLGSADTVDWVSAYGLSLAWWHQDSHTSFWQLKTQQQWALKFPRWKLHGLIPNLEVWAGALKIFSSINLTSLLYSVGWKHKSALIQGRSFKEFYLGLFILFIY